MKGVYDFINYHTKNIMKIVVIGGGAAGMMFSTQYKKANPEDEIILFEKSSYVAWAGCPTPYFIADELKKSDVLHGTPEDFIKRGIDVKIHHEVTEINFENKTVTVKGNEINGIIFYDKLVIAVGAKSFVPNITGYSKDLENVFTLSHAEHAFKIKDYLNENKSKLKNAVVVGAGFIGLEMAESFRKNGLNVTLIEKADQIFPNVSENLKKRIYKEIENNDNIVVGFSGGPDSVFLVEMLKKLQCFFNFKIYLVHINHLLRGEDADSDENFSLFKNIISFTVFPAPK